MVSSMPFTNSISPTSIFSCSDCILLRASTELLCRSQTVKFGGATRNLPPYVIPLDGNLRIKDKGRLTFDIVLKEAGIYDNVHIMEVLPKFSQLVFYYIELLERL